MTRINIYNPGNEHEAPTLAGWFDSSKAHEWSDRDYNGNGSGGTGRGQAVIRTAGGRWVLEHWTAWQGEKATYEYISDETAKDWLLRNNEDAAVEEFFGEIAEEEDLRSGEKIMATGKQGPVTVMLDGYVKDQLVMLAGGQGVDPGELAGRLLAEAVMDGLPYTVTVADISKVGVREISSRHATRGAAVEALRAEQRYDAENNGLPSHQPRVEHDGRPIDVED